MRIHNFGFGPNRDGQPSVSFSVTLDNGLEGTIGWTEDAEDAAKRESLMAYYEPKILELMGGEAPFKSNVQDIGFEADR